MKIESFKIVFIGSGPFAEPVFKSLIDHFTFATIILVVKRGKQKTMDIVSIAKKNGIPVLEVADKNTLQKKMKDISPGVGVVVSFGMIISKETLSLSGHGFINVHYSLLPKYRGASPVQSAVLAGDKVSGITFQKMAHEVDTGEIIFQQKIDIKKHDTTESLGRRMAALSAEKIPKVIMSFVNKKIAPEKQNESDASYSKIITKSDGKIDWSEPAEVIERKVRAYTPWPSAYTYWNGKLLKILVADVENIEPNGKIGTFIILDSRLRGNDNGVEYGIQTGKGVLIVNKVQLEGKKPLKTSDFILGNSQIVGSILG